MVQGLPVNLKNYSDVRKVHSFFCKSKDHYRIYQIPQQDPILSQLSPVYAFAPHLSETDSDQTYVCKV